MLYLKSLEIENVRCFGKKQRIDFTYDTGEIAKWTVILGDNGTGKTSILRSIVSMLPTPKEFLGRRSKVDNEFSLSINNGFRNAWSLMRKDGENPSNIRLKVAECMQPFSDVEYEIDLVYSENHRTKEAPVPLTGSTIFNTELLSPVYCFAYGANRKMSGKSLSGDNLLEASLTLFDEEARLQNSEEYFLQLDYESAKSRKGGDEMERVKKLLLKILPSGVKNIRVSKTGRLQREVQVETSFGWVPLTELSLGYKTTIAWSIDFATKMIYYHEKSRNPFEEPAILIIDEIDLHMHPAWQHEIIENLSTLFPKTQFIVTAHSPLIAQAALDSNLVLLKKTSDQVKVVNEPNIVKSWRIDQVLTSDLFGLKEPRNKKYQKILDKRRTLLMKDELSTEESDELHKLESKLDEIPVAETQEYIKAMEIILKASKHSSNHDSN